MVKKEYSVQDHIRVFEIVQKCEKLLKTKNSRNNSFLTEKMVKKGYYGNECLGLARDRIEVR